MGRKLQGTAALILLAAAWFAWRRMEGDGARGLRAASEDATGTTSAPRPLPVSAPPEAEQQGEGRAALDPETPAESEPDAPPEVAVFPPEAAYPFRIEGRVRDERGLPLPAADIYLAPHLFPFNRAARTDAEGRFALAFEGRRPTLDCAFSLHDGGLWLGLRELHLVAGQALVVDVRDRVLVHDERIVKKAEESVPALEELGYARAGEATIRNPLSSAKVVTLSVRFLEPPPAPLDSAPELVHDAKGRAHFVDPPPVGACTRNERLAEGAEFADPAFEELNALGYARASLGGIHRVLNDSAGLRGVVNTWSLDPPGPNTGARVRGVLLDAAGEPASGLEVGWAPPGRTWVGWARTDADGAFVLEDVTPGEIELGASGGALGRAGERVTLLPGEERTWSPRLDPGRVLTGSVRFASGDPLAGLRIELASADSLALWSVAGTTDESGRFAFANLPAGPFELRVFGPGRPDPAGAFPVHVVGPVFAGADLGEVVLGEQDVIPHALSVALVREDGHLLEGGEVRVWQASTGRGLFALEDPTGCFRIGGLPAGAFRVEVGGPLGWRDLGLVWVEKDVDLGVERFPAAGAVVLGEAPGVDGSDRPVAASLWSRHPDVFGQVLASARLGTLFQGLRAGDFVLCAETPGAPRLEIPLRVESSVASGLTLRAGAEGALEPDPHAVAPIAPGEVTPALRARCAACHLDAGG